MKKRRIVVVAAVLFLAVFAIDTVLAAGPIPPISDGFLVLEDFLTQGYLRYTRTIDFILTFLIVTVVTLVGAKRVFEDQARQAKMLAIVIGLISAYALVMGAGFSWLGLPLLWKFLFGWIALTLLFAYMGMKKLWAAITALLIMLALFYLGGWLVDGDGTDWFKNFGGHSTGSDVSQPGDELRPEDCERQGVFDFDRANAGDYRDEIESLVTSCSGKFTVWAYTSEEGNYEYNNKTLAPARAEAVKNVIKAINPDARVLTVPDGPTWKFTHKWENNWLELTEDQRREIRNTCNGAPHQEVSQYEEYLAPNRRFILRCDECTGAVSPDKDLGKTPESCQEIITEIKGGTWINFLDMLGLKNKVLDTAEKLKLRDAEEKLWSYKESIEKCKKEVNKNDLIGLETYYTLLEIFNLKVGSRYIQLGHWNDGKEYFQEVVDGVREVNPKYYTQVPVYQAAFNQWGILFRDYYITPLAEEIASNKDVSQEDRNKKIDDLEKEVEAWNSATKEGKLYMPKESPSLTQEDASTPAAPSPAMPEPPKPAGMDPPITDPS